MQTIIKLKESGLGAVFSSCRKYRYGLFRVWDKGKDMCMFIGLNPSTADETTNDPTIRRCIGFAKQWGYGGLIMANLFAFRATRPIDMKRESDPIGKLNNWYLQDMSRNSKITIASWGINGVYLNRDKAVSEFIPNLYCLGITKDGHPKHPLYLKKDLMPIKLKSILIESQG